MDRLVGGGALGLQDEPPELLNSDKDDFLSKGKERLY